MPPQETIELLLAACDLYKQASYQNHSEHWDSAGPGGRNCPECNRAKTLREQAHTILDRIK